MVCPKCKAELPIDSEFCQVCGVKLSPAITQEPIQETNNNEELLAKVELMEIQGSHPVIIQSSHIYCSADRGKYYLRCNFKSLSSRVISALMIDILCFDVWGNELSTIQDAQILDLSPQRDEVFGYSQKISITDVNTRTVKIKLKKMRFADGTIEDCLGEGIKIPEAKSLEEHFNSQDLTQQYISATSSKAVSVPVQVSDFWRCSCGQINSNMEENCIKCNVNKQMIFDALNTEFLSEKYTEYIEKQRAYEEKCRQLKELQQLIKQKKQEEIERERMAQIEEERNLAIQKRLAATAAANKREKKKKIIILSIIAVVIAIFIVKGMIDSAYNGELRNFATETMDASFTNVYADVVSINPQYFVYHYKTTSGGFKLENTKELWEVVCRCKTVEGKYIWASFFYQYYPDGNYSKDEDDYRSFSFSSNNPMRLTGRVNTTEKVNKELDDAIGDVLVLDVRERPKKPGQ